MNRPGKAALGEEALLELSVHRPGQGAAQDKVAVEAPLTVRAGGRPWITLMRSPGQDRALIAGLLRAEAIVQEASEILSIEACAQLDDPEHEGHVYTVALEEGAAHRLAQRRRSSVSVSSCGLCGKEQIESCLTEFPTRAAGTRVQADWVRGLPTALREGQVLFDATGAVHAAGVFVAGEDSPRLVCEDVGRHNAVDKALGYCFWLAPDVLEEAEPWLAVSGRVSFEIVQKAAMHGCGGIVAVSAPTSLAVQLAQRASMVLVGFTRGDGFVCYAGASRIEGMRA